jgi:hypothetical protein
VLYTWLFRFLYAEYNVGFVDGLIVMLFNIDWANAGLTVGIEVALPYK